MGRDLRKQSRDVKWSTRGDVALTTDEINTGSLLRIADATELMARRYSDLIDERDRYKRWYENDHKRVRVLEHRTAALRGVIGRMKRERGE